MKYYVVTQMYVLTPSRTYIYFTVLHFINSVVYHNLHFHHAYNK